jgi:hypothetical protein
MSTTTTYTGIRIVDMPDLGAVTDDSSVVGEHAGSGRFGAPAFRTYMQIDAAVAPALNNIGRNLLHNSLFNVQQRGAGPWTVAGYTMDRWLAATNLDAISFVASPFSDASRAAIGDESARFALHNTFTGNAGAAAFNLVLQPIENVRRLAGKTVTVSFWAASAAALRLGISLDQYFGTGGSPSARVNGTGQSVALGASFARYSMTFGLPSISGMTLGTNSDSATILNIWFSSGATNATRSGIGVQSGTVDLWGIQLEIGTQATPLEKPDPQQDLAKCQRFFQLSNFGIYTTGTAGQWIGSWVSFGVTMRAAPSIVLGSLSYTNASGGGANTPSSLGFIPYAVATANGAANVVGAFTASADL